MLRGTSTPFFSAFQKPVPEASTLGLFLFRLVQKGGFKSTEAALLLGLYGWNIPNPDPSNAQQCTATLQDAHHAAQRRRAYTIDSNTATIYNPKPYTLNPKPTCRVPKHPNPRMAEPCFDRQTPPRRASGNYPRPFKKSTRNQGPKARTP